MAAQFASAGGMASLLDAVEALHAEAHAASRIAAARVALLLSRTAESKNVFKAEAMRRPGLQRSLEVLALCAAT